MPFAERRKFSWIAAAWVAWLAVSLWLTVPPFLWHVEYFKKPGAEFHRLLLLVLPLLAGGVLAYQHFRRGSLWRYEPLGLAGLLIGGCLIYQAKATFVVLWLLVACYAAGRGLLRRCVPQALKPTENLAMSCGIGFGMLICLLFVLGLAGGYYSWVFWALLAVPSLVWWRNVPELARQLREMLRTWQASPELQSPLVGVCTAFATLFLLFTMLVTLAPSMNVDAMLFHLPEIRYYAETHSLQPVPHLNYSYYPQAAEVVMTFAYAMAGQAAAEMVHPLFFLLTLLLAYLTARRCRISRVPAIAGVVFAGTIPFLHWTGSNLKNDFLVAFFQLGALYGYLRGRDTGGANWLRLGVFFLSISFGVKHVAVFGAIPLGLLYLHASWRRPRLLASLVLLGLVFGFFWHARTYALTGNPIYPAEARTAIKKFPPIEASERPASLPLLYLEYPWITHFRGKSSFESPSENPCGIFLVLFWPLWLVFRRDKGVFEEKACLFFTGAYYLYWGYIWGIVRYALVPFILLTLLTTARVASFHESAPRALRWVIRGALTYCFLFAMLVTMLIEVNAPQLKLFAGQSDARGYLREAVYYYPAVEYLQQNAGPDDLILSVDNVAHGYAPFAGRFQFISYQGLEQTLARFREQISAAEFDYLILPSSVRETFVEVLDEPERAELAHEDESFSVYRLAR